MSLYTVVGIMKRLQGSGVFSRKISRLELLTSVLVVLIVVLAMFTTLGSHPLEGSSMEPTTYDGQSILIVRAAYWFGEPQRGDVITFRHPTEQDLALIKRVIALPGEWVEVTTACVYINDEPLTEPYTYGNNFPTYPRTLVPEDCYFVLGDHRNRSTDSRYWGMLPRRNITGRAWLVYWPLSDWHLIHGYSYDID
jgi:signal peptidase I